MNAKEYIETHLVESKREGCQVIAVANDGKHFFHVHLNEEIPTQGYFPAICYNQEYKEKE